MEFQKYGWEMGTLPLLSVFGITINVHLSTEMAKAGDKKRLLLACY